MHFDLFTLLPKVFPPYLNSSMMKRAQEKGLLSFGVHNIRDWTHDKHHVTDDNPYGGGGGMIWIPKKACSYNKKENTLVIKEWFDYKWGYMEPNLLP